MHAYMIHALLWIPQGSLRLKVQYISYQYVLDINIVTTVYAVVCTVHVCIYVCTRCYLLWTPGYIYA